MERPPLADFSSRCRRAVPAHRLPHPARHAFDEADHDRIDSLARPSGAAERALRADRAPSAADAQEVSAKCRFLIYRNRVETETDFLVGKREDTLRRDGQSWLIARRKIILDQNVLLTKNLTFFF